MILNRKIIFMLLSISISMKFDNEILAATKASNFLQKNKIAKFFCPKKSGIPQLYSLPIKPFSSFTNLYWETYIEKLKKENLYLKNMLHSNNIQIDNDSLATAMSNLSVHDQETDYQHIESLVRDFIKKRPVKHIAFLPDGNRRWWKKMNSVASISDNKHTALAAKVSDISQFMWDLGIHTVTFLIFSTNNWYRDLKETNACMEVLDELINEILPLAKKRNIRMVHLGRKDRLPNYLLKTILKAEEETREFSEYIFNIAIDYSSPDENIRAIKKIFNLNNAKNIVENLTEEEFEQFLDPGNQPWLKPDIIVRTGDAQRLSGYVPPVAAYSELVFLKELFPDCDKKDFLKALSSVSQSRQTSYGK